MKFQKSESDAFVSAIKNNVENAQKIVDKMVSGSEHLIATVENGELSGAAYTASKYLFGQLIIPTIKTFDRIVDDIESDLGNYTYTQDMVAKYSEDLDSEKLEEQIRNWTSGIEMCNRQIRENNNLLRIFFDFGGYAQSQLYENERLKSFMEACEDRKLEDQEKLERLLEFNSQTLSLFKDSYSSFPTIIRAISDLSATVVDINGNFYLPANSSLEFFQSLTTISLSTQKSTIEILAQTYGFSEEVAHDMQELMVLMKAAYPDLSEKEITLKLMLLFSSPVYGDDSGWVSDNLKWDGTTGSNILTKEEFMKELRELGYTDKKANRLFTAIQSQNKLVSYPEIPEEMEAYIKDNGVSNETLKIRLLNAGYSEKEINKLIKSQDSNELYQVLANESSKVDFAHMMVTSAAELNHSPSFAAQIATNTNAVKAAGWLGDISNIAMAPSIDNSDYTADLDAVNIARRIVRSGSLSENLQSYYSELEASNTNRAIEFKEHYSIDTVIHDSNKADGTGKIIQTIQTPDGPVFIYDNSLKSTLNPIPKNFVESLEKNSNSLLGGE